MKIKNITAREILDSRGTPTIEAKVILKNGLWAKASVPSGASTGIHEAWELRDGDKKRYGGKGVLKAVNNVNKIISPALSGYKVFDQQKIDQKLISLDGTTNKSKLGANAILAVSLACARAGAVAKDQPLYKYLRATFKKQLGLGHDFYLPRPMMNVINGGLHADSGLDIQEFMIVPQQRSAAAQVRCGAEVFAVLRTLLKAQKLSIGVGDEGGFAPHLGKTTAAFDILLLAIKQAGYQAGRDVKLAIDAAASGWYKNKKYRFENQELVADQLTDIYQTWLAKYPLVSIEDGLSQDDWAGWARQTAVLKNQAMLVGDDLFVTNTARLSMGIAKNVASAVLIKVNQIGSLSETIDCVSLAHKHGYKVVVSHRSGETVDPFIADLAVAAGVQYLKAGSLSRGERLAKYNRLTEIEAELKSR